MLVNPKSQVKKEFRGVTISDIHLGHRNTPTKKIDDNLRRHVLPLLKDLDVLICSGDLFDRSLLATSIEYQLAAHFAIDLCQESEKHQVSIRVLKGTPDHDYEQSAIFDKLKDVIGYDVKYINTLSIEKNGPGGYTYLYIPDKINDTTDITKEQIIKLLKDNNLKKVDIVVMHGMFEYQFPKGIKGDYHDFDFFNSITNYVIFNGHIHDFSNKGLVVVPGSFDKTTFADTNKKGFIKFFIKNGKFKFDFIENTTCQVYETIKLDTLDSATVLATIADRVKELPDGSRIKIVSYKDSFVAQFESTLLEKYPNYFWVFDEKSDTKKLLSFTSDINASSKVVNITASSISNMLAEQLATMSVKDIDTHLKIFREYI